MKNKEYITNESKQSTFLEEFDPTSTPYEFLIIMREKHKILSVMYFWSFNSI
jgi:hypothetical protein